MNFVSQIDHKLVASFIEYINYKILNKSRAFSTISTGFYLQTGIQNTQVKSYASPYKQFLFDTSVTGVQVITGVSGNGVFIGRGTSGLSFDYLNGRILFSGAPGLSQFSGTFSVKDINVKYTTKSVEDLLTNTKYVTEPIMPQALTGIKTSVETYPIVFVNYTAGNNTPRSFGGMDDTNFKFDCLAVMDTPFILDGTLGILRDLAKTEVGILDPAEIPLNISGDLKSGYAYTGVVDAKTWPNAFHIDKVNTVKADWRTNNEFGQNIFIGEASFSCILSRWPRL